MGKRKRNEAAADGETEEVAPVQQRRVRKRRIENPEPVEDNANAEEPPQ